MSADRITQASMKKTAKEAALAQARGIVKKDKDTDAKPDQASRKAQIDAQREREKIIQQKKLAEQAAQGK